MAADESYLSYVVDQIGTLAFERKSMFGGIGFFYEGTMFGMIGKNVL